MMWDFPAEPWVAAVSAVALLQVVGGLLHRRSAVLAFALLPCLAASGGADALEVTAVGVFSAVALLVSGGAEKLLNVGK
jgi:hypothetical protein